MLTVHTRNLRARLPALTLAAVALFAPLSMLTARAQMANVVSSDDPDDTLPKKADAQLFRLEMIPVGGGAELLTVFGSLKGLQTDEAANDKTQGPRDTEVPLVSILRDTLGDSNPENDRLRYVWML